MKKITVLCLTLILIFTLAACSGSSLPAGSANAGTGLAQTSSTTISASAASIESGTLITLGETILISPGRLTNDAGTYSLHPRYAGLYDLKIGLTIDPDEQLRRLRRRESPAMLRRFVREWIPMENRYLREWKILDQCDLVIHLPASADSF